MVLDIICKGYLQLMIQGTENAYLHGIESNTETAP
jgi:hypothetical protein